MTSKERLLIAINRGKPDRLPITVHQWQKFHLDNYLGGISDLEAFDNFGFEGGYILSCTDHFFYTPVHKLQVFTDAARECAY